VTGGNGSIEQTFVARDERLEVRLVAHANVRSNQSTPGHRQRLVILGCVTVFGGDPSNRRAHLRHSERQIALLEVPPCEVDMCPVAKFLFYFEYLSQLIVLPRHGVRSSWSRTTLDITHLGP
jgi:hypothetical protein